MTEDTKIPMPSPTLNAGQRLVVSAYTQGQVADYGNARAVEARELATKAPSPALDARELPPIDCMEFRHESTGMVRGGRYVLKEDAISYGQLCARAALTAAELEAKASPQAVAVEATSEQDDDESVATKGTTAIVDAWNALPDDLRLSPHLNRLFDAVKTCRDVDYPMHRALATTPASEPAVAVEAGEPWKLEAAWDVRFNRLREAVSRVSNGEFGPSFNDAVRMLKFIEGSKSWHDTTDELPRFDAATQPAPLQADDAAKDQGGLTDERVARELAQLPSPPKDGAALHDWAMLVFRAGAALRTGVQS